MFIDYYTRRTTLAQSKVAVANIALQKIGSKRIASFNEDSAEARAITIAYPDILDEVLGEHPWTFAQQRFELAQLNVTLPMTEDNMNVVYSLPPDLINVNFISDRSATVKIEAVNGATVLLSDTSNLKIIYTFRNDNPVTYFPLFTMALATRLASEIAFNMSESVNKANALYEEYEKIRLMRAVAKDSQQGTPLQAIQDEWEWARFTSGSGLYARPGDQTWTPYW